MKANWKWALMCVAALALVACDKDKKGEPQDPQDPEEETFVSKVNVKDNSIAEWDNLPSDFVFETVCPDDAAMLGLKKVKVYVDKLYINLLVEYDPETVTDFGEPGNEDNPGVPFHVYLNTDNSDETGGYADEFADANTDICLEGALYREGQVVVFNPAVFKWWGEVGGSGWEWMDPSTTHDASDFWGAIVGEGQLPVATSQCINGIFEIQIMRELIPATWDEDEFGIGFDIQQNWSSVGVLPCASPTDDDPSGLAHKLQVKIDK